MRCSCDQVPVTLRTAANDLVSLACEYVLQEDEGDVDAPGYFPVKRVLQAAKNLDQRMKGAAKNLARELPGMEATKATPQKVLVRSYPYRMRFQANTT